MRSVLAHRGVRAFLLVWIGQVVSLLGSGLTAFALGVWIFQQTRSTTQYALVTFCAAAPPLLVLPLAGPLIDRWNRKRLLIACDLAGAVSTSAVGLLVWAGALSVPLACLAVAVTSSATALQWPTYAATVTTLVPREQLGRASGMTHLAHATSQVLAPLLAGAIIALVGLAGIAAIDLATFLFSTAMLLAAAIPAGPASAERQSYWKEVPFGLRYIAGHAGLAALLLMFTAVNFFSEMAAVLFTPMVLGFATPAALGTILAVGGLGMIGGGAVMSIWGGFRRPALGAALFAGLSGLGVALVGLSTSLPLIAAAAAGYFFCLPLMMGSSQVVWQRAVPAGMQGRVFAMRGAIAMSAAPLASLAAGPLADGLFEPMMAAGAPAAAIIGPLMGEGPGRGIALIFVTAGGLSVLAALAAASYEPLRRLDETSTVSPAPAPAGAPG